MTMAPIVIVDACQDPEGIKRLTKGIIRPSVSALVRLEAALVTSNKGTKLFNLCSVAKASNSRLNRIE